AMQLDELKDTLVRIDDPIATPMVKSVTERLQHLFDIGLGYMTLYRQTASLSGGESQRVKMIRHLNSRLTCPLSTSDPADELLSLALIRIRRCRQQHTTRHTLCRSPEPTKH
ncbi:hypothetical protein, partial [Listeria monocytogenes]|uniref:hypothetical protein n=1 Tax=Listeria monocytogenes TaxID=1639 RepID=UPI000A591BF0